MSRLPVILMAGGLLLTQLSLGACASQSAASREALERNAAYWQRANVTETAYMDGPKVQQMLHRDIARCVTELRELENLGTLRNAVPAESGRYRRNNAPAHEMARYETPDRDGYLLNEHGNYHDFETCMVDKGWERLEHVPYDTAEKSRSNYLKTIIGEKYRSKMGYREEGSPFRKEKDGDYDHLND